MHAFAASRRPALPGVAVLRRDGHVTGHVATTATTFWAPFGFWLRRQWWVWYIVVWTAGHRERSEGTTRMGPRRGDAVWDFTWDAVYAQQGHHTVERLPVSARGAVLAELGIAPADI